MQYNIKLNNVKLLQTKIQDVRKYVKIYVINFVIFTKINNKYKINDISQKNV